MIGGGKNLHILVTIVIRGRGSSMMGLLGQHQTMTGGGKNLHILGKGQIMIQDGIDVL
jgi:hypothetical protein